VERRLGALLLADPAWPGSGSLELHDRRLFLGLPVHQVHCENWRTCLYRSGGEVNRPTGEDHVHQTRYGQRGDQGNGGITSQYLYCMVPAVQVLPSQDSGWLARLFPSPMRHPDIVRQGWIRGLPLHNFLVILYHLARIPLPLCAVLVALLVGPSVLTFHQPKAAGALLAGFAVFDVALLALLPVLGVSFGWIQPPWLLFSAGRSGAAALVGSLVPAAVELPALAGVQLALTCLVLYGSLVEPFWVEQTRLPLHVRGFHGPPLRLLLLTDLHVERLTRREHRVLDTIRRERPDLILIGGDLLNLSYVGEPRAIEEVRRFLGGLAAPLGVYLVRGTVDVDPPHVVARVLDGLDQIRLLDGERIRVGNPSPQLEIVGLPADGDLEAIRARLRRLVEAAPRDLPLICLHHTPDLLQEAAQLGLELYLAGHTHGGQICLPLVGPLATASRFGRRYVRGTHRLSRTQGYVSRGLGLEGLGAPRIRFLARPELVWISLESGEKDRETG